MSAHNESVNAGVLDIPSYTRARVNISELNNANYAVRAGAFPEEEGPFSAGSALEGPASGRAKTISHTLPPY